MCCLRTACGLCECRVSILICSKSRFILHYYHCGSCAARVLSKSSIAMKIIGLVLTNSRFIESMSSTLAYGTTFEKFGSSLQRKKSEEWNEFEVVSIYSKIKSAIAQALCTTCEVLSGVLRATDCHHSRRLQSQ